MILIGLDPSQTTGHAWLDAAKPLSAAECGTFRTTGDCYEAKAADLARQFNTWLKSHKGPDGRIIRPDLAVIEMPPRTSFAGGKKKTKFMGEEVEETGAGMQLNALISGNQMTAALCAVMGLYGIAFEVVSPMTWRNASYGFGRKVGWARKDWKKHAREMCDRERIIATNDDMAEAVWIAHAGKATQTYRMLDYEARKVSA